MPPGYSPPLMHLLRLFSDNLLPVFLAVGLGWLLAARSRADHRPLADVGFYLLSPCLVYQAITGTRLPAEALLRMAALTTGVAVVLGAVVWLIGRRLRWSRTQTAAAALVAMFTNAGNFGLSANLFAFGPEGLAQASLYFVATATLAYTLGVFVASLGRATVREALIGLVRVPAIWAVVAAFAVVQLDWKLPLPLERSVEMLGDACIPVFLLVLGMQLKGATLHKPLAPIALAAGLRLVGGAVVAVGLVKLLGLEGPARQAAIFQAAMPSAVITTIIASQYEVETRYVTSVVMLTTLLSPFTLTPIMSWLTS